jgi:hypothetical protein
MTPHKLCLGTSGVLLQFTEEVFKYDFADKPDYSKLRFLLTKVLLEKDITPNLIYDWSMIPVYLLKQTPSVSEKAGSENALTAADEQLTRA